MSNDHIEPLAYFASMGDDAAIVSLYNIFCEKTYHLANVILKDKQKALSVTEDSFIDLIENIHKLEFYDEFSVWLKEIVFRHCAEYFAAPIKITSQKRQSITPDHFNFTPGDEPYSNELTSYLINFLDNLTEVERSTAYMFCCSNLFCGDIAFAENLSVPDVVNVILTVKDKLEKAVTPYRAELHIPNGEIPFAGILASVFSLYRTDKLGYEQAVSVANNIYSLTGMAIEVENDPDAGRIKKSFIKNNILYKAKYRHDPAFEENPDSLPKNPEKAMHEETKKQKNPSKPKKSEKAEIPEAEKNAPMPNKGPDKIKEKPKKIKGLSPKIILIIVSAFVLLAVAAFAVFHYFDNYADSADKYRVSSYSGKYHNPPPPDGQEYETEAEPDKTV